MAIKAIFSAGVDTLTVSGLHQWDYGQKLEIHGLGLPAMIEVHFACLNMAEAHVRIGTTADGVTTVAIPDGCLEHDTPLRAWVYVVDATSGRTEKTIMLPIQARTKPQGAESRPPFVVDEYKEAIESINTTVDNWRDGIVCQNDGAKLKIWEGTRAEFDALEETDDHTLYVITDELPDYTDLVRYYEAIINGDTAVPKATQAHYSMDGHSLNTMGVLCDYVQQVQDNEMPVPKATQAHYDASGRGLNKMCYFGDKFQKLANQALPGEGTYQIVAQYSDGSQLYFPFVLWRDGLVTGDCTLKFPGPGKMVFNVNADGTFSVVSADTGSPVAGSADYTYYARLVSPFAGW